MSMMVSFVLSFFPRDVLDEILNLIESVSEDFPSYSFNLRHSYILERFSENSDKYQAKTYFMDDRACIQLLGSAQFQSIQKR